MTEHRPDTDDRAEPGGTPSARSGDNLIDAPAQQAGDPSSNAPVPGAYEADDAERERGKAVKPGN